MFVPRLAGFPFLALFAGCTASLPAIPADWMSTPPSTEVRAAAAIPNPSAASDAQGVRIVRDMRGARLLRGETALTPDYAEIESFEVSAERKEVVFSARRKEKNDLDVALVSIDGSDVHWIPEDPADEVQPRWARGNKVAYIVRNRAGDFVRTVHIPTAFQLLVDFPSSVIREVAWEDAGERFAVLTESAAVSPRVEVMKYDGTGRREAIAPAVRLDVTSTPLGNGLLLRPAGGSYGEKLPLVIWVTPAINSWNPHRGRLLQKVRAAALVADDVTDEMWKEAGGLPWVGEIYLVFGSSRRSAAQSAAPPTVLQVVPDESIPAGHYRREGNVLSAHPSVVESFAASFIEHQLKGTPLRGPR